MPFRRRFPGQPLHPQPEKTTPLLIFFTEAEGTCTEADEKTDTCKRFAIHILPGPWVPPAFFVHCFSAVHNYSLPLGEKTSFYVKSGQILSDKTLIISDKGDLRNWQFPDPADE